MKVSCQILCIRYNLTSGIITSVYSPPPQTLAPGAVAESEERGPRVQKIGRSISGRVKLMTCQVDACRFLAWRSALIG